MDVLVVEEDDGAMRLVAVDMVVALESASVPTRPSVDDIDGINGMFAGTGAGVLVPSSPGL